MSATGVSTPSMYLKATTWAMTGLEWAIYPTTTQITV